MKEWKKSIRNGGILYGKGQITAHCADHYFAIANSIIALCEGENPFSIQSKSLSLLVSFCRAMSQWFSCFQTSWGEKKIAKLHTKCFWIYFRSTLAQQKTHFQTNRYVYLFHGEYCISGIFGICEIKGIS